MSAGEDGEEYQLSRRGANILAGLAITGAGGATLWKAFEIYRGLWHHEDGGTPRDGREDKHGKGSDGASETPYKSDYEIRSWEEALPGNCRLDEGEKEELVQKVDSYDNLDGDDFFDYVGREVRFRESDSELRMEVDPDYSGEFGAEAEYVVERGYNVEGAC